MQENKTTAEQEKPATETKTQAAKIDKDMPTAGQVPVATPQPMVASPSEMMKQDPNTPFTQAYALHISIGLVLMLTLIGVVIFRKFAEWKRHAKQCPHCKGWLERWADRCDHCPDSIFIYPTVPPSK